MFCWAGLRDLFEWRVWKYCRQFFSEIDRTFDPFSYITLHTPTDSRYQEIYILGDLNCNFLSNPLEVHTTHLLDLMVEYQLAQFIKEPAECKLHTRIDVFITYTPAGDTHIKVKGMLIVSLSDVNCQFWCHLKLFLTLYLPVKVSLRAVHK